MVCDDDRNETFGFHIPMTEVSSTSDKHKALSVMVWDHDYLSADEPLGNVEIKLDTIPRDTPIEQYYKLEGAKSGEIHLMLRRTALTSPPLRSVCSVLYSAALLCSACAVLCSASALR